MKNSLFSVLVFGAFLLFSGRLCRADAKTAAVILRSPATAILKVLGNSTLHKWEANATQLDISGSLLPVKGSLLEQIKAGALQSLTVSVAVGGLKSTEGVTMDHAMFKAMDLAHFTGIQFQLRSYAVQGATVTAQGALTIHGVAKNIELKGLLSSRENKVSVNGSYDLLMSDYGIKPPVMMLGTVRVADKITIAYDYDLGQANP
jgi:polyisoprenoid-binding protein YceI